MMWTVALPSLQVLLKYVLGFHTTCTIKLMDLQAAFRYLIIYVETQPQRVGTLSARGWVL